MERFWQELLHYQLSCVDAQFWTIPTHDVMINPAEPRADSVWFISGVVCWGELGWVCTKLMRCSISTCGSYSQ
eukprot:12633444-Alexandrium_andersonii.AAC.1